MRPIVISLVVLLSVIALGRFAAARADLDLESVRRIREYRKAVVSENTERVRTAWEGLRRDGAAVAYMRKNLPNLYRSYQRQGLAYGRQARSGATAGEPGDSATERSTREMPARVFVGTAEDMGIGGGEEVLKPVRTRPDPDLDSMQPRKVFIDTAEDMGIRQGKKVAEPVQGRKKVFVDTAGDMGIRTGEKAKAIPPRKVFVDTAEDMGIRDGKEVVEPVLRRKTVFVDTAEDMGIRTRENAKAIPPRKVFIDTAEDLGLGSEKEAKRAEWSDEHVVSGADLADLMVRHGDRGGGAGGRDVSSGTARLVEEYSGAPSSGQSDRDGSAGTIGGDPSSGDVSDLAVLAKASREETRKEEGRKTQDKRTDRQASEDQWEKTMSRMEADRQKQEDRIADLLKKKQEIAAQMIAQAGQQDGGMLSGSEFVDRMGALDREYERESQVLDDMLTRIASARGASGGSPGPSSATGGPSGMPGGCEGNFSLNADSTLFCKCPGYKFDYSRVQCVPGPGAAPGAGSVASSGPGGTAPVDTRTVQCSTTTKSGGDAPAQITVNLGSSVGTARFAYDMFHVKDRMIVSYGGSTVLDTGCVRGKGSAPIPLTGGSSQVTVVVQPACETKGTSWNFRVECP